MGSSQRVNRVGAREFNLALKDVQTAKDAIERGESFFAAALLANVLRHLIVHQAGEVVAFDFSGDQP